MQRTICCLLFCTAIFILSARSAEAAVDLIAAEHTRGSGTKVVAEAMVTAMCFAEVTAMAAAYTLQCFAMGSTPIARIPK